MEYTLKRGGHADLKRIYPMLQVDYRDGQLPPQSVMQLTMLRCKAEMLLLKDEKGVEVGYAWVRLDDFYGCAMPLYMALYPTFRGVGAEASLALQLRDRYADRQMTLVPVPDWPNTDAALQMAELYDSLGFTRLSGKLRLGGRETALMYIYRGDIISFPESAERIVERMYSAVMPATAKGFVTVS